MKRLKSKCSGLIFIILFATSLACSSGDKKENKDQVSAILDTLNYEKEDYDSMRAYFNANPLSQSRLNHGIEVGDTNAIKLKKLLTTEYESRSETGVRESEINALIFSYYSMKTVREKFEEIESRLPKDTRTPEEIRKRSDSTLNHLKNLKKEMLELVDSARLD